MKKMVPSFRRYSEPCLSSESRDETDCRIIPPLHDDMIMSNNHKNEKFNDGNADCDNNNVNKPGLDNEEFDDDWFVKLAKRNETTSERVPPYDGLTFDESNFTEIPFLFGDDMDFKERTMRTFRRGMKKLWKRGSATITQADPTNKVVYLGNYLTGWAKGEGCVEKPLHTIWKNYSTSTKPDVQMKLTVTQSGLKAITKDHGLTEYWSHRITYCCAPENLPRVFCWVYRHEGRKLKQELRCHAVLCSKESIAKRMASTLRLRLVQALTEFKRDKIHKQNARLSLANSVYENPSLPRRKILLSIGSQNYRPPLERSKSAPKLMSIEESLEEEDKESPKTWRKTRRSREYGEEVDEEEGEEDNGDGEAEREPKPPGSESADEKSDFKLTNLYFVKKLCSSIENLVESTSNYGKKLLSERRCSKDSHMTFKKPEDSILKKPKSEDGESGGKKSKVQKNVKFEGEDTEDLKEEDSLPLCKEPFNAKEVETSEIVVEVKDQESDEGSNSLQSNSSWSSDVSSLVTVSSDKSNDGKMDDADGKEYYKGRIYETSMERLQTYLTSCNDRNHEEDDVYLDDEKKVILDPMGGMSRDRAGNEVEPFPMTRLDREETDSFSEEDEDRTQADEDVVSDESGYVELADHIVKRLSLDRKEKDVPYHQIIKSNLLRPRRFETSCLQV